MFLDGVIPNSSEFLPSDTPAGVKFSLFIKTQEIKQIEEQLRQVMLLPKKSRNAWVKEHESMIENLLDSFVNDSLLALDGADLDEEAVDLSVKFVTRLRDAINTVKAILREPRRLRT